MPSVLKLIEDNCSSAHTLTSLRRTRQRSAIFHWQVAVEAISTIKQIDFLPFSAALLQPPDLAPREEKEIYACAMAAEDFDDGCGGN